jgi:hypothetical protein
MKHNTPNLFRFLNARIPPFPLPNRDGLRLILSLGWLGQSEVTGPSQRAAAHVVCKEMCSSEDKVCSKQGIGAVEPEALESCRAKVAGGGGWRARGPLGSTGLSHTVLWAAGVLP